MNEVEQKRWWTRWADLVPRYFPAGSLRRRLAGGSLWSTLASLSLQATAMVAAIATARILGKAEFGELSLVRSTVVTFGVLAGSGLGLAATKFVAEFRSEDPERAGRLVGLLLNVAFILSGLSTVFCVALSSPIATGMFEAASLASPLRVAALLLFLGTINGVQLGVLGGLEDFRTLAVLAFGDALLTLVSTVLGAWLFGLMGAVVGAVLAAAIAFPVKQAIVKRRLAQASISISYRGSRGEVQALWSFVLPALLLGLSAQPFEWIARVLLARQPDGFANLGIFAAAYAWGQVVMFVPSQLTSPSMPILANLYGRRDRAGFLRMFKFVGIATAASALTLAGLMSAGSRWIMRAYGSSFVDGSTVVVIIALAYAVAALSSVFRAALVATGQMWWQNVHAVIWGVSLFASFMLLSSRGAVGLAGSYLIAFCVVVLTQGLTTWLVVRRLRPPMQESPS